MEKQQRSVDKEKEKKESTEVEANDVRVQRILKIMEVLRKNGVTELLTVCQGIPLRLVLCVRPSKRLLAEKVLDKNDLEVIRFVDFVDLMTEDHKQEEGRSTDDGSSEEEEEIKHSTNWSEIFDRIMEQMELNGTAEEAVLAHLGGYAESIITQMETMIAHYVKKQIKTPTGSWVLDRDDIIRAIQDSSKKGCANHKACLYIEQGMELYGRNFKQLIISESVITSRISVPLSQQNIYLTEAAYATFTAAIERSCGLLVDTIDNLKDDPLTVEAVDAAILLNKDLKYLIGKKIIETRKGGVSIETGEGRIDLPIWMCTKHPIVCGRFAKAAYTIFESKDIPNGLRAIQNLVKEEPATCYEIITSLKMNDRLLSHLGLTRADLTSETAFISKVASVTVAQVQQMIGYQ